MAGEGDYEVLLLLDGLDELDKVVPVAFCDEVLQLEKYEKTKVIITTRTDNQNFSI
jgi:hypothetical protein